MTIKTLLDIPVPVRTATYTPISHKNLLSQTRKIIEAAGFDWKFNYRAGCKGKTFVGTFVLDKSNSHQEFKRMLSVMNSYNKTLRVGISSGVSTFVCNNGCITGDAIYVHKHTGNVDKELENVIQTQVQKLDNDYNKTLQWFEELKVVPLSEREMKELANSFIDETVLYPTQYKTLLKEIERPSYDYGNTDSLYQFYQHCTHAVKNMRPDIYINTFKKLNNKINEVKRNKI